MTALLTYLAIAFLCKKYIEGYNGDWERRKRVREG